MTLKNYKEKRDGLLNEMQSLIDKGELDKVAAKKKEIEDLDAAFEQVRNHQADLNALRDSQIVDTDIMNKGGQAVPVDGVAANKKFDASSPEYRTAFLKNLLDKADEMTQLENAAFVQTTGNTTAPLPTTMLDHIWNLVSGEHAIMGDVNLYRTGTILEVVKHTAIAQGAAKKVAENAANDDEQNTFVKVSLSGNDFSKHVDISYAAAKMSIDALEKYLVDEISAGLGEAMAADVVSTVQTDINASNKITTAAAGKVTYKELATLMGKLKRVSNVVLYATRATIFEHLVGMVDESGRPIFTPPVSANGYGTLLGATVKFEDAVAAGVILVGDPKKVTYNMVQDIMVEMDKDVKKHVYTYSGYARGQGALIDDLAFAQLTVKVQ